MSLENVMLHQNHNNRTKVLTLKEKQNLNIIYIMY